MAVAGGAAIDQSASLGSRGGTLGRRATRGTSVPLRPVLATRYAR